MEGLAHHFATSVGRMHLVLVMAVIVVFLVGNVVVAKIVTVRGVKTGEIGNAVIALVSLQQPK